MLYFHFSGLGTLGCQYQLGDGTCLKFTEGETRRDQKTWYDAQKACRSSGGYLPFIDGDLAAKLKDGGFLEESVEYWVGLTASHWKWNNGKNTHSA